MLTIFVLYNRFNNLHNDKTMRAPFIYVTANLNDIIDVDFLRNPFIRADVEAGSDLLNPDSLQIQAPSFIATGFDSSGNLVFQEKTTATFQPSQGLYLDVVTGEQTGLAFDIFEFLVPPEATTVFHSHLQGVELFYVLGGDPFNDDNPNIADNDEVIFELNADLDGVFNLADPNNPFSIVRDEEIEINGVELTKGSFVGLATGKIHTWSNTGKIPARIIALLTPAGIGEGFARVGAPAGLYDPSPEPHPILAANNTNNLIPTGRTPTEVEGIVPGDPEFYDFFTQVDFQPEVLQFLGFNPIPQTVDGVGSLVLYGVPADGSPAFQIDPPDGGPSGLVTSVIPGSALVGDDSPTLEDAIPAPSDPFANTSFETPFSLMRFGQNDGILNPNPVATNLFQIGANEFYSQVTTTQEVFRVLSGEVVFSIGDFQQTASEGDYFYIDAGQNLQLQGTANTANVIQFSVASSPLPETITLRVDTTEDQNDGSAENGLSLRDAIIIANRNPVDNFIIELQGGQTYLLEIDLRDENEALAGDLDILAGGRVEIVGIGDQKAVIDASGLEQGDRVFEIFPGAQVRFDNLKITGGRTTFFGGIFNGGDLTITNSEVSGNFVEFDHAGIYNSGRLVIDNSLIADNEATRFTGGIVNFAGGDLVITNSVIENNRASFDNGGITNFGTAMIQNTRINNNDSLQNVGGIFNGNTLTLIDSEVIGNSAILNNGGISNLGSLTIERSTIADNISGQFNGGVANGGFISIQDSVIRNNVAAQFNGGFVNFGNAMINNTEISNNVADFDNGGISNNGALTLTNSRVINNRALQTGGGIGNYNFMNVIGTEISNNSSNIDGGGITNYGTFNLQNSSVVDNRTAGNGGAIANYNRGQVVDSVISNNSAELGDGGILNSGNISVIRGTIANNITRGDNGGVGNSGSATLVDSTVENNQALNNGGLGNSLGTLEIVRTSILNNSAVQRAGGVGNGDNRPDIASNTTIIDSLISGNSAAVDPGVSNFGDAGDILDIDSLTVITDNFVTSANQLPEIPIIVDIPSPPGVGEPPSVGSNIFAQVLSQLISGQGSSNMMGANSPLFS
ncbi:Cupin 2 conserved barrel domain protein [Cyanobacterium stanieri PCC 7202]|uniref:Cupin 2 conserved barrel domain protein n=1 Tax=Cyanobacterium stanieri (strain ATCC 29140 / PCC 7202) TaxID=292563 RepID=K9YMQ3_CYASC|nr:Cupin 2 conserved barrel domain protein [Cyanobacterium stanieri PCC 7202]